LGRSQGGALSLLHRQLAQVALTSQGFGRGLGCRATPDDHHGGEPTRHGVLRGLPILGFAQDNQALAAALPVPTRDGVQRGRGQRLAGAQIETRVMPGTANGIAHQQAFGERTAVVRARRAHRKYLLAAFGQEYGFTLGVAQQQTAVFELTCVDPLSQIRSSQLARSAHARSSRGW